MAKPAYKFQMYKRLQVNIPKIYADAKKAADNKAVKRRSVKKAVEKNMAPAPSKNTTSTITMPIEPNVPVARPALHWSWKLELVSEG